MRLRLLAILSALSLLLCVAVVGLWVRSYWVGDVLLEMRDEGSGRWEGGFFSTTGVSGWWRNSNVALTLAPATAWARMDKEAGMKVEEGWYWHQVAPPYVPSEEVKLTDQWNVLGFGWAKSDQEHVVDPTFRWSIIRRRVTVPYWSIALVTGVLPLTALWRRWIKRRLHTRALSTLRL